MRKVFIVTGPNGEAEAPIQSPSFHHASFAYDLASIGEWTPTIDHPEWTRSIRRGYIVHEEPMRYAFEGMRMFAVEYRDAGGDRPCGTSTTRRGWPSFVVGSLRILREVELPDFWQAAERMARFLRSFTWLSASGPIDPAWQMFATYRDAGVGMADHTYEAMRETVLTANALTGYEAVRELLLSNARIWDLIPRDAHDAEGIKTALDRDIELMARCIVQHPGRRVPARIHAEDRLAAWAAGYIPVTTLDGVLRVARHA